MMISISINLLLILCCVTTSSIGVIIYSKQDNVEVLLFIISGYLLTFSLFIQFIIRFFRTSIRFLEIIIQFFIDLFHIITGILLILNLIHHKYSFHQDPKHWELIIPIIFIIGTILITISLCLIVINYLYCSKDDLPSDLEAHVEGDSNISSYSTNVTVNHNNIKKEYFDKDNYDQILPPVQHIRVSKKISGQTLVDDSNTNNEHSNHCFKHLSEESSELEHIIKTSIERQSDNSPTEYSHYNNNNWMDSGSILHALVFSDDLNCPSSSADEINRSKKVTFGFFGTSSKSTQKDSNKKPYYGNNKHIYDLRYSKSVPNNLRNGIDYSNSKLDELKKEFTRTTSTLNSKSMSNLGAQSYQSNSNNRMARSSSKFSLSTILTDNSNNFKSSEIDVQLTNKTRRVSLLNSNFNSENNLTTYQLDNLSEKETYTDIDMNNKNSHILIKRSKSTGTISEGSKRMKKREQRWKSINDEKIFLSNVSESLLPPVLKSGESPIMELKRQQQEYLDQNAQLECQLLKNQIPYRQVDTEQLPTHQHQEEYQESIQTLSSKNNSTENEVETPPMGNIKKFPYLSPVGEVEFIYSPENNENEEDGQNLPYIYEFDEPINQNEFEGFDQGTVIIQDVANFLKPQKKKGAYRFDNNTYQNKVTQHEDNSQTEVYNKTLAGLEKIPKSTSHQSLNWTGEASSRRIASSSAITLISLKDWDENASMWHENRSRSGVNLNIPGIARLVSNHNLKTLNNKDIDNREQTLLLPPAENRLDNIDNLSDLHSATGSAGKTSGIRRPSYSISSRSFSAPSLHTFRHVSQNSSNISNERVSSTSFMSNNINESSMNFRGNQLSHYITPPDQKSNSLTTTNSSPIKRFFQESPKRFSSVFRKKSMTKRYSIDMHTLSSTRNTNINHKHSSSVVSNQYSLSSAISSRSNSPRKSLKSFLTSRTHQKHHSSSPSFSSQLSKTTFSKPPTSTFNVHEKNYISYIGEEAIDFWDLDTAPSTDKSRVSSVPSVVIGEYDREKWRTLKALQNQERVSFEVKA